MNVGAGNTVIGHYLSIGQAVRYPWLPSLGSMPQIGQRDDRRTIFIGKSPHFLSFSCAAGEMPLTRCIPLRRRQTIDLRRRIPWV
jgi:hypothetical protein